uniref:Uncharacterized protein n=1 Tax=Molossus molossus TaxID=27622 RepID=A0A7J8B7I9_MOLMO|nr:hypothetical protein HJG59_010488 [Molossus molossus]
MRKTSLKRHLLLTTQQQKEPAELLAQALWVQVCVPVLGMDVHARKRALTHMSVGVRVCADSSAHGTGACVCLWAAVEMCVQCTVGWHTRVDQMWAESQEAGLPRWQVAQEHTCLSSRWASCCKSG